MLQLTRQHILESGCLEELEERGESSLAIRLEGLHQVAHWQGEHNPIYGVGQSLRNFHVAFVRRHSSSVHRCHLMVKRGLTSFYWIHLYTDNQIIVDRNDPLGRGFTNLYFTFYLFNFSFICVYF
jgi:hypothetical protein